MDVIDIEYSDDGVIFIVWFNIAFFDSIIHDISSDHLDSFLSEVYFIGEIV